MQKTVARDWWLLGTLWVALSALAEVGVAWLRNRYPLVASQEGIVSDDAIFLLLRIAAPVFVLVLLLLVYMPIRFRATRVDSGDSPFQVRHNRAFIGAWVGLSVALNVFFVVNPGITGLAAIRDSASAQNQLVVNVTGSQWSWQFDYPQYGLTGQTELVLPVNRTVKFVITSKDVIHGFWIPSFRLKADAVPGQTRVLYLTPNRLVSTTTDPQARVQCSELCGIGHAWMRSPVRVVTAPDFQAWVAQQLAGQGM